MKGSLILGFALVLALCVTGIAGLFAAPKLSTEAGQLVSQLGQVKQQASKAQKKVDVSLWPDLGVPMQTSLRSFIQRTRPVTRKRAATETEAITIQIKATITKKLLSFLNNWGQVSFISQQYGIIVMDIAPGYLSTLASLSEVISVGLPGDAQTNKVNTSQGDFAHRADLLRSSLNVDGEGVKIGVLSDSIDLVGLAQATGDLPPNITVLAGAQGWGLSEGAAMMELIYDLAPKATFYFATAFGSDAAYAHNILNLAGLGCKVIVDNVFYFQEPVFEDGPIAQAVDQVAAAGVLYFSAAGNQGNTFYHTSTTYEGDYTPGTWTAFSDPSFSSFYQDVHYFQAGQGYNVITGSPRFITLHWSDPYYQAYADYDLFVFEQSSGNLVGFSASSSIAFEIVPTYYLPASTYIVVVARYFGPQRMISLRNYDGVLQVNTPGNVYGHAAAKGAFAVGAILQSSPQTFVDEYAANGNYLDVEHFTSQGPRRVHYQNGLAISPDLSSTGGTVRLKPDFVAADGVSTVIPGFQAFYGTSASVSHAAGIAVLAVSAVPNLTPAKFKQGVIATAIDTLSAGFDDVSGYGVIDAVNLVNYLKTH